MIRIKLSFIKILFFKEHSWKFSNGRGGEIINKLTHNSNYVSIFITHFLNIPAENPGVLWKLYIDLKLSTRDIEKLTQFSWSKTSILEALKKHKIKKNVYTSILKKEEKMETLIKIIINISLLLGSGYCAKKLLLDVKQVTTKRIKKGFSNH